MICSVPHTGTRTLQRVLGETGLFHFGQNEGQFVPIREHIDFPIRDPLATSLSWRSYNCDRDDMGEFPRWEKAIAYLADYEPGVTVHRMEDYPVLEGKSGETTWWQQALKNHDLDALRKLPEIQYLIDDWYPRHEDFFKPYYGDFWWQEKTATLSS